MKSLKLLQNEKNINTGEREKEEMKKKRAMTQRVSLLLTVNGCIGRFSVRTTSIHR
jgi:hypothetical protein